MNVLIVDDDESVLEFLQSAVEFMGYKASAASTATQALGKLRTTPEVFPIVITDIMMPGINGIELLRLIKKEKPDTIVIMLTANASMELAVQSLNEGAFSFLSKPVNLDEFSLVLKKAADKYNQVCENMRNIEELSKNREYLENIVQNMVYMVVATDSQGRIQKINKAMENLLGYTEDELIGKSIGDIFSPEFKKTEFSDIEVKGHVKDFPVTFIASDGRYVIITFTGSIMKDAHGHVIGFLGTGG